MLLFILFCFALWLIFRKKKSTSSGSELTIAQKEANAEHLQWARATDAKLAEVKKNLPPEEPKKPRRRIQSPPEQHIHVHLHKHEDQVLNVKELHIHKS